jgi:hypothetical protein
MNTHKLMFAIGVLLSFHFPACGQGNSNIFFEKILNDYSRNSYFVVLRTEISGSTIVSIIDNDDLFYYFKKTKNFEKEKYQEHMLLVLKNNWSLKLNKGDYNTYGFSEIKRSLSVEKDASKGKQYFLDKYFNGKVLSDTSYLKNRELIIEKLFNWKVLSHIDDETGFLMFEDVLL